MAVDEQLEFRLPQDVLAGMVVRDMPFEKVTEFGGQGNILGPECRDKAMPREPCEYLVQVLRSETRRSKLIVLVGFAVDGTYRLAVAVQMYLYDIAEISSYLNGHRAFIDLAVPVASLLKPLGIRDTFVTIISAYAAFLVFHRRADLAREVATEFVYLQLCNHIVLTYPLIFVLRINIFSPDVDLFFDRLFAPPLFTGIYKVLKTVFGIEVRLVEACNALHFLKIGLRPPCVDLTFKPAGCAGVYFLLAVLAPVAVVFMVVFTIPDVAVAEIGPHPGPDVNVSASADRTAVRVVAFLGKEPVNTGYQVIQRIEQPQADVMQFQKFHGVIY